MDVSDRHEALAAVLPLVHAKGMRALIEFARNYQVVALFGAEGRRAIDAVGGNDSSRVVHDTFYHYLAGETEYFPDMRAIVHILGFVDAELKPENMQDAHRILVTRDDRLGNVKRIEALASLGYESAYSFEPLATSVHFGSETGKQFCAAA